MKDQYDNKSTSGLDMKDRKCDGCFKLISLKDTTLSDSELGEFCRSCSDYIFGASKRAKQELNKAHG